MKTSANLVWAIVVLFIATLASVILLVWLVGVEASTALVASLVANLGTIVAVLANFQRTGVVEGKVDQVAADAHDLVNGLLDAKVRAGVAEVLVPHMVDPEAAHQLRQDRARVEQARDDE